MLRTAETCQPYAQQYIYILYTRRTLSQHTPEQREHEHMSVHVYARNRRNQCSGARRRAEELFIIFHTRTFVHRKTKYSCTDIVCVYSFAKYTNSTSSRGSVRPNKIVLYPENLIINFSIVSNIVRVSVQLTTCYRR